MNRARLLMIGVLALALGAFVSTLVYQKLQSKGGSSNESGVPVVVAAADIQVGAKIGDHDVRVAKFRQSDLPAGAYSKASQVTGRGVILPISKGEFVLPTKLAAENAGAGLPSMITNGWRAVSVRVNEVVSVAGFVTPDTYVDVLLTGTPAGSSEPQTTTVLQNVRVLAAGHNFEKSATGEAQNTAVITLLVTPDDAQRLTLASQEGRIQLALRNPLDTRQEEVPPSSARALFKGVSVAPSPSPVRHAIKRVVKDTPPPPPPTVLSVEVYQGDKKQEIVKFPEESPEPK
jgi:pilus assembly protein CpaB